MFRPLAFLRSKVPAHINQVRPYQRVLHSMEQGVQGLLAAEEVFKEFEFSCRSEFIYDNQKTSLGSVSPRITSRKPLTEFCGDAKDVEPFTILLLKVLCDLHKLEEMRFLFTQCLLELNGGRSPSIELFNVYLLAISMTDAYSQNEVDNVIELMRCKAATPDIVTKLSVFILYLRLGQDSCVSWWKVIHAEVREVVGRNAVPRFPLLPLRVQHCFQTLIRLHHDVVVIRECFDLLHTLRPESCTPALLLPYMILSVTNEETPPSNIVDILRVHELTCEKHSGHSTTAPFQSSSANPKSLAPSSCAETPADPPLLNSEATVFRLLLKCFKWGDADAARYVCEYLKKHETFNIIADENQPLILPLYAGALARSGLLLESLEVLEGVAPPLNRPGRLARILNGNRRIMADSVDAVGEVVRSIHECGVGAMLPRLRIAAAEGRKVTAASLDLFIAACALGEGDRGAEGVLATYPSFGVKPTCFTYTALLWSYRKEGSAFRGMNRLRSLMRSMAECELAVDDTFLREAMEMALSTGDLECALAIADQHAELHITMDSRQCTSLLEKLSIAVDVVGTRRALRAMRSCKTLIDSRSVEFCKSTFENWKIKCDDLTSL
ncbi:unnamed protein product [Phytomonas sp. Hart1]|nr:unnamed protein product [Phytomonas sp. Hart1]|eukprot:CCW68156.1 unnamed protein product [Phytomonas sp. isolate Hart1]